MPDLVYPPLEFIIDLDQLLFAYVLTPNTWTIEIVLVL